MTQTIFSQTKWFIHTFSLLSFSVPSIHSQSQQKKSFHLFLNALIERELNKSISINSKYKIFDQFQKQHLLCHWIQWNRIVPVSIYRAGDYSTMRNSMKPPTVCNCKIKIELYSHAIANVEFRYSIGESEFGIGFTSSYRFYLFIVSVASWNRSII